MDGLPSAHGLNVLKSVVEVHNHEADPALTLVRLMVERNAQEMRRNLRVVMQTLVQVQIK